VLVMTASESWYVFLPAFAFVGLGLGLGWAYASVGTQVVVPPALAAMASGVTLTALVAIGGVAVAFGATPSTSWPARTPSTPWAPSTTCCACAASPASPSRR
jgi:hypothetical protein